MPKFIITCSIESAEGWQQYSVEAADRAEALALHKAGKSEFDYEDINVTELGKPSVEEAKE